MNIKEASQLYISYVENTKRLSDSTIKAYKQDINLLLVSLGNDTPVKQISKFEIRQTIDFLFSKGQAKSTVKRRLACYQNLFSWLENEELIQNTPFHKFDVKIKLPHRLPRNLSNDELRRLRITSLENIGVKNTEDIELKKITRKSLNCLTIFIGLELLLTTGLRVSELTAINFEDIHLKERYININGKGQRERRVFITTEQIGKLLFNYILLRKQYANQHQFLLINKQGNPVTSQNFRLWLKSLSKNANLSRVVTPHMYRHSAATKLLEAGVNLRYVQRLLGHQSITTTQIYTHVNDSELFKTIVKANVQEKLL